jgi:hypothetical protein
MCQSCPCTTVVYNFHTSLVVVPNLAFAWYPSKPQNNWVFSMEPMSIYWNLGTPTIRGRKPVNSMNEEIGENLITCKNAQAFCMIQLPFLLCKICYIHSHNLHKFCGVCFSAQYRLLVLLGSDSTLPNRLLPPKNLASLIKWVSIQLCGHGFYHILFQCITGVAHLDHITNETSRSKSETARWLPVSPGIKQNTWNSASIVHQKRLL